MRAADVAAAAQIDSSLRLLAAVCATAGCLLAFLRTLNPSTKPTMDSVYNIQVLLRAAEFLERKERGKWRALTTSVRGGTSYCFQQQNRQWESGDFVHV